MKPIEKVEDILIIGEETVCIWTENWIWIFFVVLLVDFGEKF